MNTFDHVFFDLEETLIESWDNPSLCNVNRVRTFLETHKITEISIFSFAIWNQPDQVHFDKHLKTFLEQAFNIKIITFPSMNEVMDTIFIETHTKWDLHDFVSVWGKHRAFIDFIRATNDTGSFVLIDDIVENTVFTFKDKNLIIETFDVTKL